MLIPPKSASPGDLVVLKENPKYSGIVITRKIVDNIFKDSLGLEPYYTLDVLWNTGDIPIGEVGSLGIGSGNLRSIIEDLVEVQNPAG